MMNLQIGIAGSLLNELPLVEKAVERTLNFDPGDTDNLNRLMANVSASMDGRPSARFFLFERNPVIIVLSQPNAGLFFALTTDDLSCDGMKGAIRAFGFDPETMEPMEEEKAG